MKQIRWNRSPYLAVALIIPWSNWGIWPLGVAGLTCPEWDKHCSKHHKYAAWHRNNCVQGVKSGQTSQINSGSHTFLLKTRKTLYLNNSLQWQQLLLRWPPQLHSEPQTAPAHWATVEDWMSWTAEWIWSRMLHQLFCIKKILNQINLTHAETP